MIDWVSIVRTSGQKFSSVIVGSVPNKVRRRRRKRALQEQHEQMLQRLHPQQCQINGSPSNGGGILGLQCLCELGYTGMVVDGIEDEIGSVSGTSGSASLASGGILSASPESISISTGVPCFRHNSLCEIHGKNVS